MSREQVDERTVGWEEEVVTKVDTETEARLAWLEWLAYEESLSERNV